jgi:hypothetical protein
MGFQALFGNTDGYGNTAIGREALSVNTNGYENTAIGDRALSQNTEGIGNIALGVFAGLGVSTAFEVICIGADGANVSESCYIGNIWQQPGGTQPVYVNSEGKLGAQVSSRRFKEEIKPIADDSKAIYDLKPVSFRYNRQIEPTRPLGFGLIAEEVENVSADLVTRGSDGKAMSVRYDAVNAMLLNEFLKEHKTVQEQQREIDTLKTELNEQRALIQKVSGRIELSKFTTGRTRRGASSPRSVLNNQ